MARHHTISYPRTWVEAAGDVAAHWRDAYQEDIPFTPEEEIARDTEEAESLTKIADAAAAAAEKKIEKDGLEAKLIDDSITFDELKQLLRLAPSRSGG
jgi:cell fate regulator YaaT (PSP1 superfamily)